VTGGGKVHTNVTGGGSVVVAAWSPDLDLYQIE